MTVLHSLMEKLYGFDIWQGTFKPRRPPNAQVQGWNGNHPSLRRLVATPGLDKVVIDLGVWKGQSTITMADAMRRANIDGCVIAIDTFLGSIEHWNNGLFARHHALPDLYQTFLENVYYAGLSDYVIPLPQTSITAAAILKRLGIYASIAHIDAAHEYEFVLRDAQAYWEILLPGGWLIGDDYHESWPGVVKAAGSFSVQVIRPLTIESPKWLMQKERGEVG